MTTKRRQNHDHGECGTARESGNPIARAAGGDPGSTNQPVGRSLCWSGGRKRGGAAARPTEGELSGYARNDVEHDFAEVDPPAHRFECCGQFRERETAIDDGAEAMLLEEGEHVLEHFSGADEDALEPDRFHEDRHGVDSSSARQHANQGDVPSAAHRPQRALQGTGTADFQNDVRTLSFRLFADPPIPFRHRVVIGCGVRPQLSSPFPLVFLAGQQQHARSHCFGQLQAEDGHAARSQQQDRLTRSAFAADQGIPGSQGRTGQGGGAGVIPILRQRHSTGLLEQDILGKCPIAIGTESRAGRRVCQRAVRPLLHEAADDPVAHAETIDIRPHGDDFAGAIRTEDARHRQARIVASFYDQNVAIVHRDRMEPHENLPRCGNRNLAFGPAQMLGSETAVEHPSMHWHRLLRFRGDYRNCPLAEDEPCAKLGLGHHVLREARRVFSGTCRPMADSTDSLKLDDYLARLLAALDSGVEGGNSHAPTVDLSARQGLPSQGGPQAEAAIPVSHEGSLSEVIPGPGNAGVPLRVAPGSPLRIGRFELRRQLGKGGCGIVFLAFDPKLQREVALKIPRPEMLLSADARKRLIREAQAAAEFDHPNLVPVYETGEFGPLCYIATAFCPGQTLGQWLEKQAFPVPVRQAARLVAIVAEAVQHAHDRGVLHRDLKPNNIILQPVREDPLAEEPPVGSCQLRGEYFIPRVVDFGLAKLMERGEPSDTRTWQILGTPKYMAPEQALAKHRDLGPAADVYALGAILYELLTGCAPYDGATDVEVLRQVIDGQLNPPRQIRPDIPRDLEAICLKAMEKNPGRRYRTAIDLADDLRRFLDGKPTIARPLNWLGRVARWARRNDQLVALIIVSAIAVVMIGVGTWYMGETRRLKNDQERARSDQELRARLERQRDYAQYIYATFLSLRSGNRDEAKDYLEAARMIATYLNEPLDFPYRHLSRLVQLPRQDIPTFANRVTALAVSADLRYLCWAYPDGTLTLWDIAQSRPVQTWKHTTQEMQNAGKTSLHLAFVGPQSKTLLVCNETAEAPHLSVWTLHSEGTMAPLANLPAVFQSPWLRCATSPDGRFSCVEHRDGTVLLWDWFEQKVAAQTRWPQSVKEMHVRTLPSGCEVAFATRDGTVGLWDGRSPPRMLPPLDNSSRITSLAFTAEGKIALGSNTGLWILEKGKQWKQQGNSPVRWVFSSPHGLLTYVKPGRFSLQQEARFWEWPVVEHGEITTAALDANGRLLCTAGEDGFVRLWRIPGDPHELGVLQVPLIQGVFVSEESPQGVLLDAQKRFFPLADSQNAPLPSPSLPILDAFLTQDGSLRVFLADGSTIRDEQWTGPKRRLVRQWRLPPAAQVRWAKFSRPAGHLLAADHLGRLYLWNTADVPSAAPSIIETSSGKVVAEAVLARDASLLAARWDRSAISIWSVAENSWKLTLSIPDATDFCFVENSGFLATAGERGAIRLWSLESGREAATFLGHIGAATCLALSPDQRTLISGGANGEVIFWDLRAQREVFRQRRHDGPVRHIRFANRGRWLITATSDQVALWQTSE